MTVYLLFAVAIVVPAVAAAFITWRVYDKRLAAERGQRRAAQREIAGHIARKDADDAEYNELWLAYEEANNGRIFNEQQLIFAEKTIAELENYIRERGMHDDAVAAAVDAQVVEEPPLWASVTNLYPLPLGTGHTTEIRRDLVQAALDAAQPPADIDAVHDQLAAAVTA